MGAEFDQLDRKVEDEDQEYPEAEQVEVLRTDVIHIVVGKASVARAVKVSVIIGFTLVAEWTFVAVSASVASNAIIDPTYLITLDEGV